MRAWRTIIAALAACAAAASAAGEPADVIDSILEKQAPFGPGGEATAELNRAVTRRNQEVEAMNAANKAAYDDALAAYRDATARYAAALGRHQADLAAYEDAAADWKAKPERCGARPCLPKIGLDAQAPEPTLAQPSTSATLPMPAVVNAPINSPTASANSAESLLLSTRLEP